MNSSERLGMELKLENKIALIAFCGNTWITDIAVALAGAGSKVAIAGTDADEINNAATTLKVEGHEILGITVEDIGAEQIDRTVSTVIEHYGGLDILVNNFNLETVGPLLDMSERQWRKVIEANLTSAYLYCKSAGRYMVEQNGGSIVNITSGLAERGLVNATAYCASMGGVLQLTRALSLEWAKKNVRVNALGIGWKDSDSRNEKKDPLASYIPMKRRVQPEDITPMVLFLASEVSSYIQGSIYHVDGGLMARG